MTYTKAACSGIMRPLLLGTTAIMACALPGHARAQTTGTAPPVAATTPPQEATPMDIIVTAQRRQERMQDVPISITAISGTALQERGVKQLQDLQNSVPSLIISPAGEASRDVMAPTIRGQGTTFQGSPGVVVYMNEVPLVAAVTLGSQGGPGNFVDVQNVQVLNGAQGTLFGRNTTGGAILLTPAKPTDKLEGYVAGAYGSYNLAEFEGMLNVPLAPNLKVRVVAQAHDRDGYTHDVQWNKDRDDSHTRMVRLSIDWAPTDFVKNYTMAFYGQSHNNGTGTVAQNFNTGLLIGYQNFGYGTFCPASGSPVTYNCSRYTNLIAQQQAWGPRTVAHDVDDFSRLFTWGINNTTEVKLGGNLTLRNIFGYSRLKSYYSQDMDGTIAPIYDTGVNGLSATTPRDFYNQYTEELQLQGKTLGNKLTYTVGGFYFRQTPGGDMAAYATNVCNADLAGTNMAQAGSSTTCAVEKSDIKVTSGSKALYAQATLDLGAAASQLEGVRLTGGYRYTWDTVSGTNYSYNYIPAYGNYVVGCAWNATITVTNPVTDCAFSASRKDAAGTWTVGLDYHPLKKLMVYAKASRGYKAGGFNAYAVYDNTRTFGPEYVTDYEAGFKSDFTVHDMPTRLNVNGFLMNYNQIQRSAGDYNVTTGGNGAVTVSTASALIKGVEVEGLIKPARQLELGWSYSHTDAHYKSFVFNSNSAVHDCSATSPLSPTVTQGANFTCLPLQYVSPDILSLHARLTAQLPGKIGSMSVFVNYAYQAAQYTAPLALPNYPNGAVWEPGDRLAGYGLLNGTITWSNAFGSGLEAAIFGTNLTNKLYAISNTNTFNSIGGQSMIFGEPRMLGLRLKYRFGA